MNFGRMLGRLESEPDRCIVVAEVAQAHDGSLGMAHAYIDAAAHAGADAIKFQTHIASAESTASEPWRVKFSPQDVTRFDYWKRMEFTEEQWLGLKKHAEEKGLLFLSSPFSFQAVDLLSRIGARAWKVASGEVSNVPLLQKMIDTGLPVILSTGMSDMAEIDAAVHRIQQHGNPLALLQCSTAYPCPPEKIGLNLLAEFRERYACTVGLSDHSGTIYPGLAAAVMGAGIVEVHVTFSREMFGPDVPASLTMEELKLLSDGVRFIARMQTCPVEKNQAAGQTAEMRRIFGKSIVANGPLSAGTVLTQQHVAFKKPGTGIAPARLDDILGLRLKRSLAADELISEGDLEPIS